MFSKIIREVAPLSSPNEPFFDFRTNYPATKLKSGNFLVNPLSNCARMSNHVGSVVLAISNDRFPILLAQGKNSRVSSGKLVASGSGSLEKSDLEYVRKFSHGKFSFDDFVRFGMGRELLEETGQIPQDELTEEHYVKIWNFRNNIVPLSYFRDLNRGALPIFVGFSKVQLNLATLKLLPKPKETELVEITNVKIDSGREMQKALFN